VAFAISKILVTQSKAKAKARVETGERKIKNNDISDAGRKRSESNFLDLPNAN